MAYTSWGQIASIAKSLGAKHPELVAAQWALESAYGTKLTGKNNFFGIKGRPGTECKTTEFVNGKEIVVSDFFLDFNTPDECIDYLVTRWHKDAIIAGVSFKGVNRGSTREEAANLLVQEKYATDPEYASKLIRIMNSNSPKAASTVSSRPISLVAAAEWFSGLDYQIKALRDLENTLTNDQLNKFAKTYRGMDQPIRKFPLSVPYFYQRDSKTGHGERSCQSSALAMIIKYINPGLINDDDDYLNIVFRYGDTISQVAQGKAMDSLGVKNKFSQNGSEGDLLKILDAGYPVAIGILHKGNISNPSGGGHWITLIGYDDQYFHVHDPFGELDLVDGGYPKSGPSDGKNQRYSRKNLMKRWLIANTSDGWFWDLSANRKA